MAQELQIEGIDVHVEGDGAETIVMIHGWPDTYRLWDSQVSAFSSRYRCVRFTLPGFDRSKPRRAYSLAETIRIFKAIVEQVAAGRKVTLMLHDWGCMFGYAFYMQHPQLVSRIVGIDIGDVTSPEYPASLSIKAKLMTFGYQIWLAIAWRVGGATGDGMTRFMARALQCKADPQYVGAGMNYPYYILWMGAYGSYKNAVPLSVDCPMLFIYGTKKPFMFHSPKWIDQLSAKPACRVVALQTGHWVMVEKPQEFNRAVQAWLAD
jgi:cis-3-alkyl-4-acyloxetan-2-one decarboxylase